MKPTKRAKKNQARQKLKLESAIATKKATQEDKILDNPTNIKIEIILLIITLVFTGIMIFLMGAIRMSPFADNSGPYVIAEEAFEDKGNAVLENHFVEGLKINNDSQPSNEDYQKVLSFNKNLLDYFMFVDEERKKIHASNSEKTDSTPSIENKEDKEITHLIVVPSAGFETKENIFVDIVNYESDKQQSKDEIAENISKQSAYLMSLKYTDEGKLKLADAERVNQTMTTKEEKDSRYFLIQCSLLMLLFFSPSILKAIITKAMGSNELKDHEITESEKVLQPKFALKISNTDDPRYSNKL